MNATLLFVALGVLAVVDRASRGNKWVWPSFFLAIAILGAAYFNATSEQPRQRPTRIEVIHSNGIPGGSFSGL